MVPIKKTMVADLSSILNLEVPILVVLGERRMRLGEVVGLAAGAIIELPKGADEPLQLLVNNKEVGTGTAVKVGENFGLRVEGIGDLSERIGALAGGLSGGLAGDLAGDLSEDLAGGMADTLVDDPGADDGASLGAESSEPAATDS